MRTPAVEIEERRLDAIFAKLNQCHEPGAAVGIAVGGKPVYRKGFGLASAELPVVLSPRIRMRIGSTSKHFTALAYLLLCEEGRAGLDDPIGKHLPELHAASRGVTARQLLGNVSGLRDSHDLIWQFSGRGRPVSSADVLAMYRDIADVNAPPGSSWIYCNAGFLMISAAIERITGQSLEVVFRERIFEPVGMHDTLLRRWDTDFVPNSATLHMTTPHGGFDRSYLGSALAGEGGIVSTVDDMLRWLTHMEAPRVGSASSWSALCTPRVLANGTSTGYGLGLFIGSYRGLRTLHHPGGVMGGNSQMLKVPSVGLDVVIMVNRGDVLGIELVDEILAACLPGIEPEREVPRIPCVTGVFQSAQTGRVVQLFARDERQMALIDGTEMPMQPDASGVLHSAGMFEHFQYSIAVRQGGLRLTHYGTTDELSPVDATSAARVEAIVGRYRSDTIGIEVTISVADGAPCMATAGRFGPAHYRLEHIAAHIWRARAPNPTPRDPVLSFDRDGFRYTSDRTWTLPFRRIG